MNFTFGQRIDFSTSLFVDATILNGGDGGNSRVEANYGHTLTWAGLTEVRDSSGLLLTNYSALSASSGFNFANATLVLEPMSVPELGQLAEDDFNGSLHPQDMVPKTLYLSDGRMIPVCVVKAEPAAPEQSSIAPWVWPEMPIGGGFPLLVKAQGIERNASMGCLVSDGHTIYALTNRHVCGAPGQPIYARLRGQEVEVGHASALQVSRLPFTDVYPTFSGKHTYLNLDVGLVEVSDARDWTTSVYGLGQPGSLADLNEQNLGLQLIDFPVSAFGSASGQLDGQIKALFYRYKSVGGYDYVADLLIAPTRAAQQTRPGDSGTVWHLKLADKQDSSNSLKSSMNANNSNDSNDAAQPRYHPLAVEWGAQTIRMNGLGYNFALATNLSNVCKLLDVELVPINSGQDAAKATFKLMDDVAKILPPATVCDAYIELGEGSSRAVVDGLWDLFGKETAQVMALGIRNLSHLWVSAWKAGGGTSATATGLVQFSEAAIRKNYENPKFVPSLDLDHLEVVLH